jgi:hypothetical protein
LEIIIVNSYLFSCYSPIPEKEKITNHKAFKQAIIDKYLNISKSSRKNKRKRPAYILEMPLNDVPVEHHKLIHKGKVSDCVICKRGGKRVPLAVLDGNKRGCEKRKRSVYGCRQCDVSLYKEGTCFNRFHRLGIE